MVSSARPDQSSSIVQDPKPDPHAAKKKKGKNGKKVGQIKAAGSRLEGFLNWVDPIPSTGETQGVRPVLQIASEPAEGRKDDMSSLATEFVARMHKQAVRTQGETTPGFEIPGGKRPKSSSLTEEVQKSMTVITLESSEQASDALLALESAAQDASKEASTSLEDRPLVEGPPRVVKVMGKAPSAETAIGPSLPTRQSNLPRRPRGPDRLVLTSHVKPMKWDHLSVDTSFPGLDATQSIIDRLGPFIKGTLLSPICTSSTTSTFEYR